MLIIYTILQRQKVPPFDYSPLFVSYNFGG
jgi:hypothetical protein